MKKYFFLTLSICILVTLFACAPKVAYQAQDSMREASEEASCQAIKTKKARTSLIRKDQKRMESDIKSIKEAEKLFDKKSGIVLSY